MLQNVTTAWFPGRGGKSIGPLSLLLKIAVEYVIKIKSATD